MAKVENVVLTNMYIIYDGNKINIFILIFT